MDIKELFKAWKKKFDALSKREMLTALLTVSIVVFIAPYIFLYAPSRTALGTKKQGLKNIEKEVSTLDAAVREQAEQAAQVQPPPAPVKLPEADDLQGMFLSISRQANALGIDFISIVPEGVSQKNGFLEMKLKLELRAHYKQIYDFTKYLGMRHRLFLIESLRFETNDAVYPSGIALIKAVTYLRKK